MKQERADSFRAASTPTQMPADRLERGRVLRFVRELWPLAVLGLGLLATVAWGALLDWLLYRAVLLLGVG